MFLQTIIFDKLLSLLMFNTALPSLIDYKVFYSREGNKIILNISGG